MGKTTSFVVPLYNEEDRLSRTVNEIIDFVASRPEESELIFVDDGSSDGTAAAVTKAIAGKPFARLVGYSQNRGKGAAVRTGMLEARNDIVFFLDVDLSTPLQLTDQFLTVFEQDPNVDIVIGTRKGGGATVTEHQPWLRENLGKVFSSLSRFVVPGISDFTCGFKAFRRGVVQRIFAASVVDGWSFDTEILMLARHARLSIREVPVEWADVDGSRVNMFRNGMECLVQLCRMKTRLLRGKYDVVL